ncbi:MAG: 5' nucleotidase, NT5C type [Bacillota bacterium]
MKPLLAELRLLLDLDGTTLKNAGREVMARELNLPLPAANAGSWFTSGILEERGIPMERFWAVWQANQEEIYARATPLPGALETLHRLRAQGAHIAVVTARRGSAAMVTREWLALHGVPYDLIQFNCDDKLAVARSLGLNLGIDDDLQHVLALSQAMPVMLMDPEGRHAETELPGNILRVRGWDEVEPAVARLHPAASSEGRRHG